MALTVLQRRRRRDTIITLCVAAVILLALFGKSIVQAVVLPDMPGYAKVPPGGNFVPLDWKVMKKGKWESNASPTAPAELLAQNGKMVVLKGFLLPLHQGSESSEFYIAENPRGCFFCNPPGMAEIAHVLVAGGTKVAPIDWPVKVYGKFKVATGKGDEATLYAIDDATMVITH